MAAVLVDTAPPMPAPAPAPAAPPAPAPAWSSLVWPPSHRYAADAQRLVETFKREALQPNDAANGWTPLATTKDVVVTKKPSSVPLGVLRGDGVISGFSTHEVFAVATLTSCRLAWDEMYEDGRVIEVLDASTTLSYAASRGQFPVSGRDFAVVLVTEFLADGRIFSMSTSVSDPKIPDVRGKVRGTLKINGWYLEPVDGNKSTRVVYISEVDINGSVPSSILNMAAAKMPMVVADVRKYLGTYGPPPAFRAVAGSTSGTEFSHKTGEFSTVINVDTSTGTTTTEVLISPKRYGAGCTVDVSPLGGVQPVVAADGLSVILKHAEGSSGTKVTLKVAPSTGSSANGRKIKLVSAGKDIAAAAAEPAMPVSSALAAAANGAAAPAAGGVDADPVASVARQTSLEWPPRHRFASVAERIVPLFKELAHQDGSAANGWTEINRAKDVVVTKRASDVPLGILRGDGVIKGYSPFEVYPVCALPACRKVWDELFEDGRPVENLDDSTILSYAATKGQFPVSGRDLCVLLINEFCLDGRIYSITASVEDPLVPPVRSKVRANLKLNGWYLEPLKGEKGTRVVYISEIDLNGSIPGAILSLVAQRMPMVVADVRKYLMRHGPPPFFDRIGAQVVMTPEFAHDASVFETKIKIDNSIMPLTSLLLSKQRYPTGCEVTLTPGDAARVEPAADGSALLLHHEDAAKNGVVVHIVVRPLTGGAAGEMRIKAVGSSAPVAAPAAGAPSASSPVHAPSSPIETWLGELPEQITRIEQAMAALQAARDPPPQTQAMGLTFLAAVPMLAVLLARVWP